MAYYCVPEKGKAALLTLSAQRDFARPESPIVAPRAGKAGAAMRRLVQSFRTHHGPVFHAVRLYRPDGSNVDACRRQSIEEGLRILMPGTSGTELVDEVRPEGCARLDPEALLKGEFQHLSDQEWAFYRPRWGAFHATDLEPRLRDQGVNTLVLCGLSSPAGTRATVYEASARDLRIVVVPDALGNATENSLEELARIGVYLMTSDSCIGWLDRNPGPSVAA